MTKKDAGKKGGLSTVQKYGVEYMRRIGKKGAARMHELYELQPVNLTQFAIIHRATGKVVAFI